MRSFASSTFAGVSRFAAPRWSPAPHCEGYQRSVWPGVIELHASNVARMAEAQMTGILVPLFMRLMSTSTDWCRFDCWRLAGEDSELQAVFPGVDLCGVHAGNCFELAECVETALLFAVTNDGFSFLRRNIESDGQVFGRRLVDINLPARFEVGGKVFQDRCALL